MVGLIGVALMIRGDEIERKRREMERVGKEDSRKTSYFLASSFPLA